MVLYNGEEMTLEERSRQVEEALACREEEIKAREEELKRREEEFQAKTQQLATQAQFEDSVKKASEEALKSMEARLDKMEEDMMVKKRVGNDSEPGAEKQKESTQEESGGSSWLFGLDTLFYAPPEDVDGDDDAPVDASGLVVEHNDSRSRGGCCSGDVAFLI